MGVTPGREVRAVFGSRIVAGAIDLLLAAVPPLVLFFAVAHRAPAGTFKLGGSLDITIGSTERYLTGGQAVLFVVMIVVVWALVFGAVAAAAGATVGMMAMGLRVAAVDGEPVVLSQHVKRTAAWLIDGFPYVLPGALGLIYIVLSPSRRRVGDLLAGTVVVAAERSLPPTWPTEGSASPAWPAEGSTPPTRPGEGSTPPTGPASRESPSRRPW